MKRKTNLKPQVDYRKFRLRNINTPEFRHLWLLLLWPVYWLRYPIIEAINTVDRCFLIYTPLDDLIPFCEYFIIPYQLWLAIMVLVDLYLMVFDIDTFKKYSWFLIVSFSLSSIIYLVAPTMQNLRPETFPRDNIFTHWVEFIYAADTSTNVCPSEHVIGSFAFFAAALHSKAFNRTWKWIMSVMAILTSIATVFLKQHSLIDLAAAVPLCLVVYLIVYVAVPRLQKKKAAATPA